MKITNTTGLPEIFYKTVKSINDIYDNPAYISPSKLTAPTRQIILIRRHWDEIERDCSTMVWSTFGTALHSVIEAYGDAELQEEYLSAEISVDGKMEKFGGTLDVYDNGTIYDFKVTSAWTILFGSRMPEWETQLNAYRYLLSLKGTPVDHLKVVCLLRDWSRRKAQTDADYPQSDVAVINIQPKEVEGIIIEKVRDIRRAETFDDEELPFCTPEERWAQPDKWALMKEGRKSAVKVFEDEQEAKANVGAGNYVEYRPGKSNRCADYCDASPFCNQFKESL